MDVTVSVLGSHAFRLKETEFRQARILAAVEVRWDSDNLRICAKVHRQRALLDFIISSRNVKLDWEVEKFKIRRNCEM